MGIYTEQEEELLKYTEEKRIQMVDNFFKDGIPSTTGEVRVVNEVLTSLENSLHTKVSNRLKNEENKNNGDVLATVVETIKQIRTNISNSSINTKEFNKNTIEYELVPGETDINTKELEQSDFIHKRD